MIGHYARSLSRRLEDQPLGGIVVAFGPARLSGPEPETDELAVRWCWGGAFHLRRYVIVAGDWEDLGEAPRSQLTSLVVTLARQVGNRRSRKPLSAEEAAMLEDAAALIGLAAR